MTTEKEEQALFWIKQFMTEIEINPLMFSEKFLTKKARELVNTLNSDD